MRVVPLKYSAQKRKYLSDFKVAIGFTFAVSKTNRCWLFDPTGVPLVEDYDSGLSSPIVDASVLVGDNPIVAVLSENGQVAVFRLLVWWKGKKVSGKVLNGEKDLYAHHKRPGKVAKKNWPEWGAALTFDELYNLTPGRQNNSNEKATMRVLEASTSRKHGYLLTVGDSLGSLHFILGKNTEMPKVIPVSAGPVLSLTTAGQAVAVGVKEYIYFLHATKMDFISLKCHLPGLAFTALALNPKEDLLIFAGTATGELVIFQSKQHRRKKVQNCKVLFRQRLLSLGGMPVTNVVPVNGYIFASSHYGAEIWNITEHMNSSSLREKLTYADFLPTNQSCNNKQDCRFHFDALSLAVDQKIPKTVTISEMNSGKLFFLEHDLSATDTWFSMDQLDIKHVVVLVPVMIFLVRGMKSKGSGRGPRLFGGRRKRSKRY